MTLRCDVVVVGAGAHGSAAAWWLARRGRHVVLLEQFEPGHVRGSSHGGSRIFRLAYDDPHYVAMAQDALPLWRDLEDDAGETLLDTTGGLDLGDPATLERTATALDACGASYSWLTAAEAAERWPAMAFDHRVLFQPDGGRARADATVAALQRRAVHHGADIRFGQKVDAVVPAATEVTVRTGDEAYTAAVAVMAVGAWTPSLLWRLVPLPQLTVTQEQIFHFRGPDDLPSFIRHPDVYGLVTPGEGVKVAEHHTGPVVHPDTRDFVVQPAGRARVIEHVRRWLPGLDPDPVTETTCLYTNTADDSFVLERHGPVVVGTACSGHGFKFTPLVGRMLADLASFTV